MQKVLLYFCFFLFFISPFYSCSNNARTSKEDNLVNVQLVIPDTLLLIEKQDFFRVKPTRVIASSNATIITTIWGDCYVCMKKFREWENLRQAWGTEDVQMVYIVTTEYPEYFLRIFYPEITHSGLLLIDNTNAFYALNNLQQEASHQNTFLVDSTFSIILQGDPLLIPSLQERYKEVINKICKR